MNTTISQRSASIIPLLECDENMASFCLHHIFPDQSPFHSIPQSSLTSLFAESPILCYLSYLVSRMCLLHVIESQKIVYIDDEDAWMELFCINMNDMDDVRMG